MISRQNRYVQNERRRNAEPLSKYLENIVERILGPEPEVFDSHTASHVLSLADIREPAAIMDFTDAD